MYTYIRYYPIIGADPFVTTTVTNVTTFNSDNDNDDVDDDEVACRIPPIERETLY